MQQTPTDIAAQLSLQRHHQDDTPGWNVFYLLAYLCQFVIWIEINDLLFRHCPALSLQIVLVILFLYMHAMNNPVERAFQHIVLVLQFNRLVRERHGRDILGILEKMPGIGDRTHHTGLNSLDNRVARKWQARFPREALKLLAQVW